MHDYLSPATFSGNVHPNPGLVPLLKFNNIIPLDIYEPFSVSPSLPKLRIAILNTRSVCNKSVVIYNHIVENNLDALCLSETWINKGDISGSLLSLLLPNYDLTQQYGRPLSKRGGGVAINKHNFINILLQKLKFFQPLNALAQ